MQLDFALENPEELVRELNIEGLETEPASEQTQLGKRNSIWRHLGYPEGKLTICRIKTGEFDIDTGFAKGSLKVHDCEPEIFKGNYQVEAGYLSRAEISTYITTKVSWKEGFLGPKRRVISVTLYDPETGKTTTRSDQIKKGFRWVDKK